MKFTISNLPQVATEEKVRELCSEFGTVTSVVFENDLPGDQHNGHVIVEMSDGGEKAVEELHGNLINDEEIHVYPAR